MKRHAASHFDHGLTEAQIAYLLQRFADRVVFFIETVELPEELGTVPCGLHGPIVGGAPVAEREVTYAQRGTRPWTSRLVDRPPHHVRTVTVVAGPHEETCPTCGGHGVYTARLPLDTTCASCGGEGKVKHTCIVYTVYGGPVAPQEPCDPRCKDVTESEAFWAQHALSQ